MIKPPDDSLPPQDNGGMRKIEDRRILNREVNFSDRRSGQDRRKCPDRRNGQDRRSPDGFRALLPNDRRHAWSALGAASHP